MTVRGEAQVKKFPLIDAPSLKVVRDKGYYNRTILPFNFLDHNRQPKTVKVQVETVTPNINRIAYIADGITEHGIDIRVVWRYDNSYIEFKS